MPKERSLQRLADGVLDHAGSQKLANNIAVDDDKISVVSMDCLSADSSADLILSGMESLRRIQMLCLLRRHNRPFLLLIRRSHNILGHRPPTLMTKIFREVGSTLEIQEHIKSFQCRICERLTRQRPARPTTAVRRQVLGMIIATSCVSVETCSHTCVLSQYRISSMKPLGFMWQPFSILDRADVLGTVRR